jgi:hypothetical protein
MIGALLAASATAFAASPPGHYSIQLNSLFTSEAQTLGVYCKARIDGGPVLRLLLDSGAERIVLDRRVAARTGRKNGSDFQLVGVGAATQCKRSAPATLQIGDLVLPGCDTLVVDGEVLEGVDGIIPLALFGDFLVRLDLPHKTLELDAYPPDIPAQGGGYTAVRVDNRLLFVRSLVNERQPGYILLDTGATYSAVSPEAASASRNYWSLANAISLHGGAGAVEGFPLPSGVRFRCGDRVISADPAVVVDLSSFKGHHPFEIAGILGYSALRNSIVTVDYRDSLVRIEGK